jgi:hypothetical protein
MIFVKSVACEEVIFLMAVRAQDFKVIHRAVMTVAVFVVNTEYLWMFLVSTPVAMFWVVAKGYGSIGSVVYYAVAVMGRVDLFDSRFKTLCGVLACAAAKEKTTTVLSPEIAGSAGDRLFAQSAK